jgi:hypothetical protein
MNLAAHVLVSNGAQLAGIWLVLIALAVASLIELNAEPRQGLLSRAAAAFGDYLDDRREQRIRRAEQAAEAARYAREIAVVAAAATVTVQRRREQWHEAQQQQDDAWAACQEAGERVTAARRVAAFDSYAVAYLPMQFAVRERYLRTAATAAHRRGEISGRQLVDALAHRNGWNPALHPADQDVALAQAGRDHLRQAYQRVVAAERAAWHETEIAVVAARTLRHEAGIAIQATTAPPAPSFLRHPGRLLPALAASR